MLGRISVGAPNNLDPYPLAGVTEEDLQGKSIVIHADLGRASRVACADILRVTTPAPAGSSEAKAAGPAVAMALAALLAVLY